MKCFTISEVTCVGRKTISYEVPEDVAEYAIRILEGSVGVPVETTEEITEPVPDSY